MPMTRLIAVCVQRGAVGRGQRHAQYKPELKAGQKPSPTWNGQNLGMLEMGL